MKKGLICLLSAVMLLVGAHALAVEETVEIVNDDITDRLVLEGDAVYDSEEDAILLCPAKTWSNGKAKYPFEVLEDFTVTFDYKIGGGSSADGIMLAFFAQKDSVVKDGQYMNFEGCGGYGLEFDTYQNSNDSPKAHIAIVRDKVSNHLVSVDEPRVDDEEWHTANLAVNGNYITVSIDGDIIINETIEFDKTYRYMYFAASTGASTDNHYIRNVKFSGRAAYSNASDWAVDEMDKAEIYDLIPTALKGKDMTQPINRYEFAALSVQLYGSVTQQTAPVVDTPFTDVSDDVIAQAFGLGITDGISDTEFSPNTQIPREQVATMLTRAMKACDSTLDTSISGVTPFADDGQISDWAKESVYFMASRGIIQGIGDNKFAPKNTTTSEEAMMYANATREQALAIAVRAYENMTK